MARLAVGGTTEQRFETLYRSHYLNILAYCVRRLPRADAEDAAAEVFEVAWRRSAQVPDDDDALPWLYGVTRKVLSNQLRRRNAPIVSANVLVVWPCRVQRLPRSTSCSRSRTRN